MMPRRVPYILFFFLWCVLLPASGWAAALGDHGLDWPSGEELLRVLTLRDYNTRVVIIGTTLLGLAAGLVGTFLLLRKRALLSDALSHATLPGIALAFILMSVVFGDGKNLIGLITGAAIFSVLGTVSVILIQRFSRLKDDAALGVVLSVYFGLGIALLGLATRMETGNAAGLSSFIYGKTASMLFFDSVLIAVAALISAIFCILFFKEFSLLCFDADYAASQGWPVAWLDFFMMTLVVLVTVIGLQAVGLILVVALLIIPPAAARFWTYRLSRMLFLSGLFGAISGLFGSGVSALLANLPAGAVIVLTASMIFIFSLFFGTARGLLRIAIERRRLRHKMRRENLLREMFEWAEGHTEADALKERLTHQGMPFGDLRKRRSWSETDLRRVIHRLRSNGLIRQAETDRVVLSDKGYREAEHVVRKHRLWEAYLINHADIAPGQVDWGADEIEHVLEKNIIDQLEALLPAMRNGRMPESPHTIRAAEG